MTNNELNTITSKSYKFIIDTDTYAGNFERDMCEYITGQAGGYEKTDQTELAEQEIPELVKQFKKLIEHIPNDNGYRFPGIIYPNTKYGNDGHSNYALLTDENKKQFPYPAYLSVAISFYELPSPELLNVMQERAKKFVMKKVGFNQTVKIEGFRLQVATTVKEYIEI